MLLMYVVEKGKGVLCLYKSIPPGGWVKVTNFMVQADI